MLASCTMSLNPDSVNCLVSHRTCQNLREASNWATCVVPDPWLPPKIKTSDLLALPEHCIWMHRNCHTWDAEWTYRHSAQRFKIYYTGTHPDPASFLGNSFLDEVGCNRHPIAKSTSLCCHRCESLRMIWCACVLSLCDATKCDCVMMPVGDASLANLRAEVRKGLPAGIHVRTFSNSKPTALVTSWLRTHCHTRVRASVSMTSSCMRSRHQP